MSTRRKKRTYSFVAYGYLGGKVTPEEHAEQNCKLGTLYISVTRFLISRTKQNDENDNRWGRRKNTIRVAKQAMEKAMQYAYRDRRNKKRDFKSLWIQRINAGVRAEGMTYSKFINGLSKCGVAIDRKILAEIAYDSPEAFKTIVQKAQSALN